MPKYARLAIVFPLDDERWMVNALPLVEMDSAYELKDLENVEMSDPVTGQLYVLNYKGYYVISPGSWEKVLVPPPPDPVSFDTRSNWANKPVEFQISNESRDTEPPPPYTYDLMPCPKTMQPFPGLAVCIESRLKEAIFLHPFRARPSEQEKAVKLESFGTIELSQASMVQYSWQGELKRKKAVSGISKWLGSKGSFYKTLVDNNGTYELGKADV